MRKILITQLGTGRRDALSKYERTRYYMASGDSTREYYTTMISLALVKEISPDTLIITGTVKSAWPDLYRVFCEEAKLEADEMYMENLYNKMEQSNHKNRRLKESDLEPLQTKIELAIPLLTGNPNARCIVKILDYGINDFEVWSNFKRIMELTEIIEHGDHVALDITHAFRSIPLFQYLMLQFIQRLKTREIHLDALYYGMLEVTREMEPPGTPVLNLKVLYEISDWIHASSEFMRYGDGEAIANQIKLQDSPERRKIEETIRRISDLTSVGYAPGLQESIGDLSVLLREMTVVDGIEEYVIPELKKFSEELISNSDGTFQLSLARWYIENRRIGFGYIALQEAALTRILEELGYPRNKIKTYGLRAKIKTALLLVQGGNWKASPEDVQRWKKHFEGLGDLVSSFFKLKYKRNLVAHALEDKKINLEDLTYSEARQLYTLIEKNIESAAFKEIINRRKSSIRKDLEVLKHTN